MLFSRTLVQLVVHFLFHLTGGSFCWLICDGRCRNTGTSVQTVFYWLKNITVDAEITGQVRTCDRTRDFVLNARLFFDLFSSKLVRIVVNGVCYVVRELTGLNTNRILAACKQNIHHRGVCGQYLGLCDLDKRLRLL